MARGAGVERQRAPGHGLAPEAPHALAGKPPGGRRTGLPQGGQLRRVRLRLVVGHAPPSGWGFATTRSSSSPPPSPRRLGDASWWRTRGQRRPRRRAHPGGGGATPGARASRACTCSFRTAAGGSAPRGGRASAFATGCSTTGRNAGLRQLRGLARPLQHPSGETRSAGSGGRPRSTGSTLGHRAARHWPRSDPAGCTRLYAATVDKFAWGRRYLTEDFFRVLQGFRHRVELGRRR